MSEHSEDEWPLRRLMTEVVGSGHKSADDMNREQASEAMTRIFARDPEETTLGAFWLANRWKRNTPTELAAFSDVMREQSVETAIPECDPVDCGANYDGKHTTAILGVAAGLVSAAVSHDRRAEMGVRTYLNTIETLANPANADVHLGSFYHLSFAKRIVDTFGEMAAQDLSRVIMFQGLEGYDDIRPGSTVVAEYDGEFEDFEIETAEYGMDFEREQLEVEDVAADSATITREVLDGDREDAFADAIALNAAVRIYAGGDVDTLDAGLDRARAVIADGTAADRLDALQAF